MNRTRRWIAFLLALTLMGSLGACMQRGADPFERMPADTPLAVRVNWKQVPESARGDLLGVLDGMGGRGKAAAEVLRSGSPRVLALGMVGNVDSETAWVLFLDGRLDRSAVADAARAWGVPEPPRNVKGIVLLKEPWYARREGGLVAIGNRAPLEAADRVRDGAPSLQSRLGAAPGQPAPWAELVVAQSGWAGIAAEEGEEGVAGRAARSLVDGLESVRAGLAGAQSPWSMTATLHYTSPQKAARSATLLRGLPALAKLAGALGKGEPSGRPKMDWIADMKVTESGHDVTLSLPLDREVLAAARGLLPDAGAPVTP